MLHSSYSSMATFISCWMKADISDILIGRLCFCVYCVLNLSQTAGFLYDSDVNNLSLMNSESLLSQLAWSVKDRRVLRRLEQLSQRWVICVIIIESVCWNALLIKALIVDWTAFLIRSWHSDLQWFIDSTACLKNLCFSSSKKTLVFHTTLYFFIIYSKCKSMWKLSSLLTVSCTSSSNSEFCKRSSFFR